MDPGDPSSAWRAVVLDPRREDDLEVLQTLRDAAEVEIIDLLDVQRRALEDLRPGVDAALLDEAPRWVYYPWRRSLVALLGPEAFTALRFDRNRNKITRREQASFANQRVGVIGLSVGHAIAVTLALEGLCGELWLADFDVIELSNLNRVQATVLELGINKAVLAARHIAELNPYLPIAVFSDGLFGESIDQFIRGVDVVIEECDSLDVKLLVRELAREHRVPVIMETSDRGLLDVERFDLEAGRPIFHGLLDDLRAADLVGLSTHDKVPYVLRILEPDELSPRMAASMAEIDYSVTTWPQLAGDIMLGGASVAAAVRRIGRGDELKSGRVRIDLEQMLDQVATPPQAIPGLEVPAPFPPDTDGGRIEMDERWLAIAGAARLAPSGGNSQPWTFGVSPAGFSIDLVPARSSTMDVQFRGSYVAAGAASYNARVAAAAHGVLGPLELMPDPEQPHRLAVLRFADERDDELSARYPAMLARCTNRQPGRDRPVDDEISGHLHDAVAAAGVHLRLVRDRETLRECGTILGASDRLRYLSPTLHSEMMGELDWPGVDALDLGLDVRTLELDDSDLAKLAVARRRDVMDQLAAWGAGDALGEVTRDRINATSALAVLSVAAAEPVSYLRGGAAVEQLWITAEQCGLAVQPVSPVFLYAVDEADYVSLVGPESAPELAALAESFRRLSRVPADEHFILVLRLSYAPAPTARSRRLPLAALLAAQQ